MYENTNRKPQNKGFTIHVGDTYVGYLTIGEKNVPAATVIALQDPENMRAVLEKAELRPYAPKVDADMSSVDAIIAAKVGSSDNTEEKSES